MQVSDTLRALSLYPINPVTIESICAVCGISPQNEVQDVNGLQAYKRAKAMVYDYLATALNVTEAGASYSVSDADKRVFGAKAKALFAELNEANNENNAPQLGWVGEDL